MEPFGGKVAVVTGGGSGIGEALCQELARHGSIVVVADIDEGRAAQVASRIAETGGQARAMGVDVAQEDQVKLLVERVVLEDKRLDFMFNIAGIAVAGEARDLTSAHWRRVLDVNLFGVLYGTMAAYGQMVRQGSGHIVNMSSFAGLTPFPTNAPYSTSKHAIVGLSLSPRYEAEGLGVRVSVACPGWVQTNLYRVTPVVNVPPERAAVHAKMMGPSEAAQSLLRGVSRNQAVIVFPANFWLLWRLYQIHPAFLSGTLRRQVRRLRRVRLTS